MKTQKKYRVKLNYSTDAQEDQYLFLSGSKDRYLAVNGKIAEYSKGVALKKARIFNGETEPIEEEKSRPLIPDEMQVCNSCGLPNVLRMKWVNPNTNDISWMDAGTEGLTEWCENCEDTINIASVCDLTPLELRDIIENLEERLIDILNKRSGELKTNDIAWINDDLDIVKICYKAEQPDGDHQNELYEELQRDPSENKMDARQAYELLYVRLKNTLEMLD